MQKSKSVSSLPQDSSSTECTVRPGRWWEVWTSEMIIIRKWWDVWEWLVWGGRGGGGGEAKWLGSCPLTASLPPPSSPTLTSPSTPTPSTTLPTPPPPPASWGPGPGPGPGVVCAEAVLQSRRPGGAGRSVRAPAESCESLLSSHQSLSARGHRQSLSLPHSDTVYSDLHHSRPGPVQDTHLEDCKIVRQNYVQIFRFSLKYVKTKLQWPGRVKCKTKAGREKNFSKLLWNFLEIILKVPKNM